MDIKLAIVGGRTFNDYDILNEHIAKVCQENDFTITEIISGGARGADKLGERYAKDNNIPIRIFPAEWDKYGKSAGFRRNKDIIDACDVCVAFWDGESRGTKHDIDLCRSVGKSCFIKAYTNHD